MASELAAQAQLPLLDKMRGLLPTTEPSSRKVLGSNVVDFGGGNETLSTQDEYAFPGGAALVDTQVFRPTAKASWQIQGLHVRYATKAQLAANDFTLAGKGIPQYLFLAWVFLSPALMIAALVKVLRTRDLRRKWLWGLLAFFGVTSIQMDWTTGGIAFNALTLQLLSFGFMRAPSAFAAWTLQATVPVGAVLILLGLWANPGRAKPHRPKTSAVPAPFDMPGPND